MNTLATARCLLFVPGDRAERFIRAAASGADAIVIDLEDAVAPKHKIEAREHTRQWLEAGHEAVVRINGAGTEWYEADAAMAAHSGAVVMLPKAETSEALAHLGARVPGVIPLIESARGVIRAAELCAAPYVVRSAFGSIDLATQLGVDPNCRQALQHARSALVMAAAAAGRPAPLDGVTTAVGDEELLRSDSAHASLLGFSGKLAIHPRQVATINDAFLPTAEQIAWAYQILEVADEGSVAVHNGQMIDRPVWLRAQSIVARTSGKGAEK